jgi:hypothetical protein
MLFEENSTISSNLTVCMIQNIVSNSDLKYEIFINKIHENTLHARAMHYVLQGYSCKTAGKGQILRRFDY